MSASGRKNKKGLIYKRAQNDLYETPNSAIERLIEHLKLPIDDNTTLYDPCSGSGNIIRTFRNYYPNAKWIASEIDPNHKPALENLNVPHIIRDFFFVRKENISFLTEGKEKVDYIITNPPYSLALEFIQKSLAISDNVIMLLRLNFLSSRKRYNFFMKNGMPDVYVLPNRPSFIKSGKSKTDACEYAWFHFHKQNNSCGKLILLGLNP